MGNKRIGKTVQEVINKLGGIQFKGIHPLAEKDKIFYKERYENIISLFPNINDDNVGLEVGLSGGILAMSIKKYFNLDKLYAIEHPVTVKSFTSKYLKIIKEENIILKPFDLRKKPLPFVSEKFDFVILSEVLEHLVPADIPQVICEIIRVVKKDGYLFVTTPNISSFLKRINLLFGKNPIEFDLRLHYNATFGHIREYTSKEVQRILSDCGFKILNKEFFNIDTNRNIFTRIEAISSKYYAPFANNIFVLGQK